MKNDRVWEYGVWKRPLPLVGGHSSGCRLMLPGSRRRAGLAIGEYLISFA